MRSDAYLPLFTKDYMMGPCSIRLLEELLTRYPLSCGGRLLDLGCGTGLTTLYAAKELRPELLFAVDLWISATENQRRFDQWQIADRAVPLHANALDLPFAEQSFDAVISVDSYHYFAGNADYFREKLLPLVKPGGWVLIAVPGLKEEFDGGVPQVFTDWAGDDVHMFHSCAWWQDVIGDSPLIQQACFWNMDAHDAAWQDWFSSGHPYALQDRRFLDAGVGEALVTVGMAIRRAI